jgi:hypothetical protein
VLSCLRKTIRSDSTFLSAELAAAAKYNPYYTREVCRFVSTQRPTAAREKELRNIFALEKP